MTVDRLRINAVYAPLLGDVSHRWLVLYGGAGSGKSVFAAQWVVMRVLQNHAERIIVTRKVARTIRQSVWQELMTQIRHSGLSHEFAYNTTTWTIVNTRTKSEIICIGLDDPEKIKSISGVTAFWHEEPTECDEQDLIQCDLRLRGQHPAPKQHIVTFNPVSSTHWIRTFFWQKNEASSVRIKTTYKHNAFLDADYRGRLESLRDTDPYFHSVYCLGEWGELSGLIYTPWPYSDPPASFEDEFCGVDFGFNNPTAVVHIGVRDGVIYLREVVYQSGLQISDLCDLPEMQPLRELYLYCDAEDPGAIEELKRRGFPARPADKGKGSVKNGILLLRSLDIRSHANNVGINKELKTYMWRKNKDGIVLDEPVKFNDHALDAVRYGIWTHLRKAAWVDDLYRRHTGGGADE